MALGRILGTSPARTRSMMIMRLPQHGQAGSVGGIGGGHRFGLAGSLRRGEQAAKPGNVGGAGATGEQAVVADAVEAVWQDMEQEAADELVG